MQVSNTAGGLSLGAYSEQMAERARQQRENCSRLACAEGQGGSTREEEQ